MITYPIPYPCCPNCGSFEIELTEAFADDSGIAIIAAWECDTCGSVWGEQPVNHLPDDTAIDS